MPTDLDHILEQGGSATPTYLMELLLSKVISIQVVGSDVAVGGATLTLEGTQLSGVYADQPTVAEAQAATGVTYPSFFATDTGVLYRVSGSSWVAA